MLGACGESIRSDTEDAIDSATAISGSGPAYVFLLIEHWTKAAKKLGFSSEEANLMVRQTLTGAVALWEKDGGSARALREKVTSKGGTTEAALKILTEKEWGTALEEGIQQAYKRAKELADG